MKKLYSCLVALFVLACVAQEAAAALNVRYVRLRTLTAYFVPDTAYTATFANFAELDLLDSGSSPISRSGWSISVSSGTDEANLLDGDTGSNFQTGGGGHPHTITLDLGSAQAFSYLRIKNRDPGENGSIGGYEVDYSTDGSSWTLVDSGTWNTGTPTAGAYFSSNELSASGGSPVGSGLLDGKTLSPLRIVR